MPVYEKIENSPYDVQTDKFKKENYNKFDKKQVYEEVEKDIETKEIIPYKTVNPKINDLDYQYKQAQNMLPNDSNKLVDLQVYQQPQAKGQNPYTGKKPFMPIEPIALTTPYVPPQYQNYVNQMMKDFYTPFIYKDYNIKIGGPNADHDKARRLFEDMAPPSEYYLNYSVLRQRCNLVGYIRGNFIIEKDGESTNFSGTVGSLNSRLNFLKINPFDIDSMARPYKNLGDGFLIYNTCYPIVRDTKNDTTVCSKSSVGINVRVYELDTMAYVIQFSNESDFYKELTGTEEEKQFFINNYNINKSNGLTITNYDQWRDVKYYSYIRDHICSKNVCPNFIQSYCYFQTLNPDIKFIHNGKPKNDYASACITLLTESPNFSVYGWGSNHYKVDRNIETMTYVGYKTPYMWSNILYQMVISFYVMYKHKFVYTFMELESNFYIKLISKDNTNPTWWKYIIDGVEYYLNNFGNLMLVDSNFKKKSGDDHRLLMNNFVKENEIESNTVKIYEKIFDNMCTIFSPNVYKNGSDNNNNERNIINRFVGNTGGEGMEMWDYTINSINSVNNDQSNEDDTNSLKHTFNNYFDNVLNKPTFQDIETKMNDYFKNIFNGSIINLVHNRIGTYLRDSEIPFVDKNNSMTKLMKKGNIVVQEIGYDTYIFVIFIQKKNDDPEQSTCITLDEDNSDISQNKYIYKYDDSVATDMLYNYLDSDEIKIDIRPGQPAASNNDHIIDTYVVQ